MADYYAILTNAGAAALAAKTTSSPVLLATMVLGDASGASYEPNPAQVSLVHQLASVPIDTVEVDPAHSNVVNIQAIVPLDVGGFTIREVGLKLSNGTLFAVIKYPPTLKPSPGEGQEAEMLITLALEISSTANIQVVASGTVYASQNYVQAARDFFAIRSIEMTSPPASPSSGDAYIVPAGATGVWAGLSSKIAIWFGADWLYLSPRLGAHAATETEQFTYTASGWHALVATTDRRGLVELATGPEAIAGTDPTLAVSPAALAELTATTSRRGLVELATGSEVIAGSDPSLAVSPAALAALTASTDRRGLVELATVAETRSDSNSLAVTPQGLNAVIQNVDSDTFFLGSM